MDEKVPEFPVEPDALDKEMFQMLKRHERDREAGGVMANMQVHAAYSICNGLGMTKEVADTCIYAEEIAEILRKIFDNSAMQGPNGKLQTDLVMAHRIAALINLRIALGVRKRYNEIVDGTVGNEGKFLI